MSRVGKKVIQIPDKTKVSYVNGTLEVKSDKGTLSRTIHPSVDLNIEDNTIAVVPKANDRQSNAMRGLVRSLVANMIDGVNKGFERVLEINGIGYRATASGNTLVLNLGYSHPIDFPLPEGVSATVDKNNTVTLSGIDKEQLGQTAAAIRRLRPPEPYKGKGIKYKEEYVRRKAGKTGTK